MLRGSRSPPGVGGAPPTLGCRPYWAVAHIGLSPMVECNRALRHSDREHYIFPGPWSDLNLRRGKRCSPTQRSDLLLSERWQSSYFARTVLASCMWYVGTTNESEQLFWPQKSTKHTLVDGRLWSDC
eukprot:7389816-Prymnesium_polylepis.1